MCYGQILFQKENSDNVLVSGHISEAMYLFLCLKSSEEVKYCSNNIFFHETTLLILKGSGKQSPPLGVICEDRVSVVSAETIQHHFSKAGSLLERGRMFSFHRI